MLEIKMGNTEKHFPNTIGKISTKLNHGEKPSKRQATYLDGSSMKTGNFLFFFV
ncbi:hypothetical protein Hanom_Chr08g00687241 [Helianthus anomalus]